VYSFAARVVQISDCRQDRACACRFWKS